jgi:hypothetical protein
VSFDPRLNLTKIVNYILELKINNELIIDSLFINFEKITKSSDLITNKILSDNLVPSNHTIVSEIANSEKCHLLSESLTYLKSNDKAIIIKGNSESKQKYNIDLTTFEKIDSNWKSYFLGWMYSDGNIYRGAGKNTISLFMKTVQWLNGNWHGVVSDALMVCGSCGRALETKWHIGIETFLG